ncbi:DUF4882 domain-containing protein [Acinetobacter guillouiae]|uniref:DUF4882 domain-containing protein n=1 Tax=Acinetobacter guillouiae TaxID=106649 RepID=UPI0021CFC6CD|nr:DUF4882 domain-containing protein [Acinetobacter guillouiae]MCU4493301.1 DUF4882 domain-containing protein [Acinetobacter guillouiae]
MKKLKLVTLFSLSVISTQGFALCRYDLDGFLSERYEPTTQKFPTVSNQKLSYKILNTTNPIIYSANHSTLKMMNDAIIEGGLTLPQSGIVGFELNTDVIPTQLTNTRSDAKSFGILLQDKNKNVHSILVIYNNSSSLTDQDNLKNMVLILVMSTDPNTKKVQGLYSYVKPIESVSQQNLGIYLNQNSIQIGLIVNKNNLGYIATLLSKPKDFTIVSEASFSGFEAASPYLNKTMSLELVTDKSKFTNTFPTGTKDACGN